MDTKKELLQLIEQKGLTLEKIAEHLSQNRRKISAKTLKKELKQKNYFLMRYKKYWIWLGMKL